MKQLTRRACGLLEVSMRSHLHVKVVAHPDIINWLGKNTQVALKYMSLLYNDRGERRVEN